jgi:hypothetical protein
LRVENCDLFKTSGTLNWRILANILANNLVKTFFFMKYFWNTLFVLWLFPSIFYGQNSKIDGEWKGIITNVDKSGNVTEFQIELRIYKNGKKITGKSTVHWKDKYAQMEIIGKIERGVMLELVEDSVVKKSEMPEGYDWCMKRMTLILKEKDTKTLILEGIWEGKSKYGGCDPGKITLEKQTPRV